MAGQTNAAIHAAMLAPVPIAHLQFERDQERGDDEDPRHGD